MSERAVIVGIGATEFSKQSGRTELQLTIEAVDAALRDAGIEPAEVDGATTFTFDSSPETEVARNLGFGDLRFFVQSPFGGSAGCATVMHAAMAIESGVADVVVCYRGFNERSGRRFGRTARGVVPEPGAADALRGLYNPFGLITPAASLAMLARRYMHATGATSEDFGRVAVVQRQYAVTNPSAWFYQRPLTLDDHQSSRWVAEPLRLYDCCQESDGAVAVVVTSERRALSLDVRPVVIAAAAQSAPLGQETLTNYTHADLATLPETELLGRQLWSRSGLRPDDVQLAILYDHFSPFVLMQLEALGFCGFGEAPGLVATGETAPGGRLPVNTHGGQLSEAYIHGMNGIAEAVRQLRGKAANQVPGVRNAIVTSSPGTPTSGLLLSV